MRWRATRRLACGIALMACCLATPAMAATSGHARTPATIARRDQAPGVPPCRPRDLRARVGWQGATGSLLGNIRLTNVGAAACSLLGGPGVPLQVEIVTLSGQSLPIVNITNQAVHSMLVVLLTLRSGASVSATLQWSNWCRARQGTVAVAITLPNRAGQMTVPVRGPNLALLTSTPRCDNAAKPSTVLVGPLRPAHG